MQEITFLRWLASEVAAGRFQSAQRLAWQWQDLQKEAREKAR